MRAYKRLVYKIINGKDISKQIHNLYLYKDMLRSFRKKGIINYAIMHYSLFALSILTPNINNIRILHNTIFTDSYCGEDDTGKVCDLKTYCKDIINFFIEKSASPSISDSVEYFCFESKTIETEFIRSNFSLKSFIIVTHFDDIDVTFYNRMGYDFKHNMIFTEFVTGKFYYISSPEKLFMLLLKETDDYDIAFSYDSIYLENVKKEALKIFL